MFRQEEIERENHKVNKDLLLMREKLQKFIRGYDRYASQLREKVSVLEVHNEQLQMGTAAVSSSSKKEKENDHQF